RAPGVRSAKAVTPAPGFAPYSRGRGFSGEKRMSNPMTPAAAPTTQLLDAAGLQCPAPAGFLDAEVDDVSAGPTATPQPAKSRQAAAEPVDPQRVRAMLERRYGGGRPLHYQGMRP